MSDTAEVARRLAPSGTLRAAINLGNPELAVVDAGGELTGCSVDLAQELAASLGLQLSFHRYDSAGAAVVAGESGDWDIAFLAIDPARTALFHFSKPYRLIEALVIVASETGITDVDSIDLDGLRIAASRGAAYYNHLTRVIRHAEIVDCNTASAAFALLLDGKVHCAAGIAKSVREFAAQHSGFTILGGRLLRIEQAVATPVRDAIVVDYIDGFIRPGGIA